MKEESYSKDWHFPRAKLATRILFSLQFAGRAPARIVADSNSGKTMFLRRDLIPAALKQQRPEVLPIYIPLGADKANPRAVILDTLRKARHALTSPRSSAAASLKTPVKKIEVLGFGLEMGESPSRTRPNSENEYLEIRSLSQEIAEASGKNVLLIFDDVQHLVEAEDADRLLTSIRAILSADASDVLGLFVADSKMTMDRLFGKKKSPFCDFGRTIPFPELDEEFVAHMVGMYKETTGIQLNESLMVEAFKRLDKEARKFMHVIEDMVADLATDPKIYVDALVQEMGSDESWAALHYDLSPLERAIVARMARNEDVSSTSALAQYARDMGRASIRPVSVERALRNLFVREIITSPADEGAIEFRRDSYKTWAESNIAGQPIRQTMPVAGHVAAANDDFFRPA